MTRYEVETVQDTYTTYTVEADSAGAARALVDMALTNTHKDKKLQDKILSSAFPNGFGDYEQIIDVTEIED